MLSKYFIFLVFLFSICGVLAVNIESIGYFDVNDCVSVVQNDDEAVTCTISTIYKPFNELDVVNAQMVSLGNGFFNYSYCNTDLVGRYIVNGVCDYSGSAFAYDFSVKSPYGIELNYINTAILICLFLVAIIFCLYGLFTYGGILIMILGFVVLFSSLSVLFGFILIVSGVLLIFVKR